MSFYAWSLLFSLSFIWGASFYFIEVGLAYLSPSWLVSLRLIVGALCLYLWLLAKGISLPSSFKFWGTTLVMGMLNNLIPFCLIAWGQQFVTGGMASIINANTAFFGVLVAAVFLRSEPLRIHRLCGVAIGVGGVSLAIGIDSIVQLGSSGWGQLAILLATLSYAFASVWGKIYLSDYTPLHGACGMLICSALLSVPVSFMVSGQPELSLFSGAHMVDFLQLVFGIGILGTACAYPLYFMILEKAGASNLMLVTIIVPIFALVLDAALLGQWVTSSDIFGFCLVIVGLVVMDGRWMKHHQVK